MGRFPVPALHLQEPAESPGGDAYGATGRRRIDSAHGEGAG
jgi:hypothetical protein